jgi:hypothetical protein
MSSLPQMEKHRKEGEGFAPGKALTLTAHGHFQATTPNEDFGFPQT